MKTIQFANVEDQYRKYAGELRATDVQKLGEWVKSQPHLPPVTELELILFLHSNYYDLEAAQRTIECYYTFRTSCKNLFGNRNLDKDAILMAMDVLALMCVDIQLWEEGCNNGSILIIDMDGIHLGHLPKLGIFTLKDLLYFIQEGLPIRLKGLHLANVVPFIDRIMTMIRPFMKKELLEMLHLHTKIHTLFPYIPQHLLPSDYGGMAQSRKSLRDNLYNYTISCGDHLARYDQVKRVDENKRLAKPRTMGNFFGLL
uniref:CRAL-TRIO domain-containing protein n=1 Tax=Anopheles merus TaxID=30066 RepID=A0A182V4R8_ANOME